MYTVKFKEKSEMTHALNGIEYYGVLTEMDNYLRGRLKYEELSDEVYDALYEARRRLHDECPVIWDDERPFKHKPRNIIKKIHGWLKHAIPLQPRKDEF